VVRIFEHVHLGVHSRILKMVAVILALLEEGIDAGQYQQGGRQAGQELLRCESRR
jgi:hypothetical protein